MATASDLKWKRTTAGKKRRVVQNRDHQRKRRQNPSVMQQDVARLKKWQRANPASVMCSMAKSHANMKGLDYSITPADIVIPTHCPVLGIPLTTKGDGPRTDNTPSLDRIDNSRGYTKDNILVVSWRANWLKSSATLTELKQLGDFYGRFL